MHFFGRAFPGCAPPGLKGDRVGGKVRSEAVIVAKPSIKAARKNRKYDEKQLNTNQAEHHLRPLSPRSRLLAMSAGGMLYASQSAHGFEIIKAVDITLKPRVHNCQLPCTPPMALRVSCSS